MMFEWSLGTIRKKVEILVELGQASTHESQIVSSVHEEQRSKISTTRSTTPSHKSLIFAIYFSSLSNIFKSKSL